MTTTNKNTDEDDNNNQKENDHNNNHQTNKIPTYNPQSIEGKNGVEEWYKFQPVVKSTSVKKIHEHCFPWPNLQQEQIKQICWSHKCAFTWIYSPVMHPTFFNWLLFLILEVDRQQFLCKDIFVLKYTSLWVH